MGYTNITETIPFMGEMYYCTLEKLKITGSEKGSVSINLTRLWKVKIQIYLLCHRVGKNDLPAHNSQKLTIPMTESASTYPELELLREFAGSLRVPACGLINPLEKSSEVSRA